MSCVGCCGGKKGTAYKFLARPSMVIRKGNSFPTGRGARKTGVSTLGVLARGQLPSTFLMSQKEAERIAGEWIGAQHLGRDLTGRDIDLSAVPLPYEGNFRRMILQAIERKLKRRNARRITLPPLHPQSPGTDSSQA